MTNYGKVGLLLNGAGAKGILQAGMVKAFDEHGIPADMIFGSSAGSLNGVMYHQGGVNQMKDLWCRIRNRDVYSLAPWNALTRKACIYDSSPLRQFLQLQVNPNAVYANKQQRFFITATNYSDWSAYTQEAGSLNPTELINMLYASASPPIYFPFVEFRGQLLADAGVITNYNISRAIEAGCDTVVIMGFARPQPSVPNNLKESLQETISIATYGYITDELGFCDFVNDIVDHVPPEKGLRKIKVVKIIPDWDTGIDLLDFDMNGKDREQLWQQGFDLARGILEKEMPTLV